MKKVAFFIFALVTALFEISFDRFPKKMALKLPQKIN